MFSSTFTPYDFVNDGSKKAYGIFSWSVVSYNPLFTKKI